MPRTIPTSTWNDRADISSSWNVNRDILDILGPTFDSTVITFDSTEFTFDSTGDLAKSIRDWRTPRYAQLLMDNAGNKILNNTGNEILLNGIGNNRVITSNWN